MRKIAFCRKLPKKENAMSISLSTITFIHTIARSKTISSQNAISKTVYAGLSLQVTFA